MQRLIIKPDGWPCTFRECRPGLFTQHEGEVLVLRTQYGSDAYLDNGDAWWGGVSTSEERNALTVQPVQAVWEDYEE